MWAPVILTVLLGMSYCSARSYCKPCHGAACDQKPNGCLYGTVKNTCGVLMCASGPGESCGGSIGLLGKCGSGLSCNRCGRCTGCSKERLLQGITECFSDSKC